MIVKPNDDEDFNSMYEEYIHWNLNDSELLWTICNQQSKIIGNQLKKDI